MFDVGFSELLIIAVVALIVLGPERLPKAARLAGFWVRKARAQWYSVKSELEFELAQEEMKKHLQDVENSIKAPTLELQTDLEQVRSELVSTVSQTLLSIPSEAHTSATPAENMLAAVDQAHADDETIMPSLPDSRQGNLW